jgi:hypothetical protein
LVRDVSISLFLNDHAVQMGSKSIEFLYKNMIESSSDEESNWSLHECIINVHAYTRAIQERNLNEEHTSNPVWRLDEQVRAHGLETCPSV